MYQKRGHPGQQQPYPPAMSASQSSFHSMPGGREMGTRPIVQRPPPTQLHRPPYFVANGASFIFMLVGVVFFLIAFGGTAWYSVPPEDTVIPKTFGLWRLCVRTECVVDMTNDYMVKRYLVFEDAQKRTTNPEVIAAYERYLVPVKALMCIAVIFIFITVVANILFILGFPTFFMESAAQILSGVLVGMSAGIFGTNFRDQRNEAPFGWSYWCGVVATMILVANGIAMAVLGYFVFRKRGGLRPRY